jgi:hypothetical protein
MKVITLNLKVDANVLPRIFHILQKGFMVKARPGCSIHEFLCQQQKINPEYIAQRISTIFLDGQPVDDIDAAQIEDGCTIALSGAMPGLVGAVMRRGSPYASFRHSITYSKDNNISPPKEGMVRLKLFNILMKELGPQFLENGVFLEPSDLIALMTNQPDDFREGCKEMMLNKKPTTFDSLTNIQMVSQGHLVFFSVKTLA